MNGKILGIGLQRTGTTSLSRALNELGFHCRHTPLALYRSLDDPMMDAYDAFTDNPIPLLYKQIDAKFPGTRFICTVRDVDSWLKSVRWLFTTGRLERNWDSEPAIARMHVDLYGTERFDEDAFRRTWERYHADVREYLGDRPQDILYIDLVRGEGWEKLCAFLDKPVPERPFPLHNKSTWRKSLRNHYVLPVTRALGRWRRRLRTGPNEPGDGGRS